MTRLKANCGCGWVSTPVTAQSKLNTITQAQQHSDATGHVTEIHGTIRPSASRTIVDSPKFMTRPASPNVLVQSTQSDAEIKPLTRAAAAGAYGGLNGTDTPRIILPGETRKGR